MQPAISVKNLTKRYGKITAVDGIGFDVHRGEVFALVGPNGAGKSTTLRILATILSPTSGTVMMFGESITDYPELLRSQFTYLPEEAGAYKNMSGLSYLRFMAALYSNSRETQQLYVDRAVALADLGVRIKDKVKTYSKGMARKLLLARALMTHPKLAILDEPTSGLDVSNSLYVRNKIREYVNEGMSVILSSHNMLEIEFLSDRVGIMNEGKIIEVGRPEELEKKYKARNLEEVFMKMTAR